MSHLVIACYRPKDGQDGALRELLREHVPTLRREGLATAREPVLLRASDGTYVELFEWVSSDAVQAAHTHPVVLAMWERFGAACDYVTLGDLAEAREPFAHFALVP